MTAVDYCITTIDRPRALERMLLSIATHRPEASIHVADQSEAFDAAAHERLAERLAEAGLRHPPTVHRLPFDCGVSAARNHLVESTPSEYKLVVDDDGVFTEHTDVDAMVALLEAVPEAGAIGLTVYGEGGTVSVGTRLERRGATLRQFVDEEPFEERAGIRFKRVDCLPNCVLARRELFDDVRWDPVLKTAAEHFDFFLRMQETPHSALYAPDVSGKHPSLDVDPHYKKLRWRGEFLKLMLVKHGLTRLEMPNGVAWELGTDGELVRRTDG